MNKQRAQPLIIDHLIQREFPLRIEVFKGSIDASVEYLRNTDLVLAIEVIEHLYPDVLENVPYNIFGFMQPKIALFSTPNSDFNVLFTPLANGFRHYDHKFEWSQRQFKAWALNICERFPNYRVNIFGVGEAPADGLDIGPVSQFAIFVRKDVHDIPLSSELEQPPADSSPDKQYEEIYSVDFPVRHDERTLDQKIFDEASYYINRYRTSQLYHNAERLIYQIPFERILEAIEEVTDSASDLRRILLANGHIIEEGNLILPEDDPIRFDRLLSGDSNSNYDFDIYEDDEEEKEEDFEFNIVDEEVPVQREEEEECWD